MITGTGFKWSGPEGSADLVAQVAVKEGRYFAERGALDRARPWTADFQDELVLLLREDIVKVMLPYLQFSPDPAGFIKAMQATAKEAFDRRCAEIAAATGQKGNS